MYNTWETDEDFERDLILYAEYCIPKANPKPVRVPDVILKFKKTMANNKKSRLLENDKFELDTEYIIPGKKSGIGDRVISAGGTFESHPLDDLDISNSIRNAVGFGYSNTLIENYVNSSSDSGFSSSEKSFFDAMNTSINSTKNNKRKRNGSNYRNSRRKNYLPN